MGFGLEVDMIRQAHEMGLLTTPYCFNPDEATAMAEAGADILIPHMGLTTKGTIGAEYRLDAGRIRAARAGDARRGQARAPRDPGALPRRPDRRTGRRPVHPGSHRGRCGLLRGQQHGTSAGRTGHRRPRPRVHPLRANAEVRNATAMSPRACPGLPASALRPPRVPIQPVVVVSSAA